MWFCVVLLWWMGGSDEVGWEVRGPPPDTGKEASAEMSESLRGYPGALLKYSTAAYREILPFSAQGQDQSRPPSIRQTTPPSTPAATVEHSV